MIINGVTTPNPGYVVALADPVKRSVFCSGVLIARNTVLTAAHCFDDPPKHVVAAVGASSSDEMGDGALIPVSAAPIRHPKYGQASTYSYDLAILRLDSSVGKQPLPLADFRVTSDVTDDVELYGFGRTSTSTSTSKAAADGGSQDLRVGKMPLFDRSECQQVYFRSLDESMLCSGGTNIDACYGDSGAPLVYKGTLLGLASNGVGCGVDRVPGVYVNLPAVADFLMKHAPGAQWVDPSKIHSGDEDNVEPATTSAPPPSAPSVSTPVPSTDNGTPPSSSSSPAPRPTGSWGSPVPIPTTPRPQASTPTDPGSSMPVPAPAQSMTHPTQTNDVTGLVTTSVEVSEAPVGLQDALRDALLDYMPAEVASAFAAMPTEEWTELSLTFFSFGDDTSVITEVLDTYANKPLFQRSARFLETASSPPTAMTSC